MSSLAGSREFGEGPLSRAVCVIYTLLVVEGLMLLTGAPGLTLLVLLGADPSNAPLLALSGLALGPSVGAGVYALHHRSSNLADLRPAAAFWRGYRLNAKAVLLVWLPWLAWLAVLAVNLANYAAAGLSAGWGLALVVVALATMLWAANATVIVSLFAFRTRDVLRLAAVFLVRTPGVALANAALLVVAVALTALTSEAVLAVFGSVFVLGLLRNARPVVEAVRAEFTA
jgi:hypothetical protein